MGRPFVLVLMITVITYGEVAGLCHPPYHPLIAFGSDSGDTLLDPSDDGPPGYINLTVDFIYFNQAYRDVFINTNGAVSFLNYFTGYKPTTLPIDNPPFFAVFMHDITTVSPLGLPIPGEIFYRRTNDEQLLAQADQDIASAGFTIESRELVIATWVNVTYFHAPIENPPVNTFQSVMVTDGLESYVIFNYDKIEWYQNTYNRSAVSVLNRGDMSGEIINIGGSGTEEMLNMGLMSNVLDADGRFVINTTHLDIISPQDEDCKCALNKQSQVFSFDNQLLWILGIQSTLIAKTKANDNCKVKIKARTTEVTPGIYEIQWIRLSVGWDNEFPYYYLKHFYFERNNPNEVQMRSSWTWVFETLTLPYTWVSDDELTNVTISGDSTVGWKVTSESCEFVMRYAPNCLDPVLVLDLSDTYLNQGDVQGICQDCDRDKMDDYRTCNGTDVSGLPDYLQLISDSCVANDEDDDDD